MGRQCVPREGPEGWPDQGAQDQPHSAAGGGCEAPGGQGSLEKAAATNRSQRAREQIQRRHELQSQGDGKHRLKRRLWSAGSNSAATSAAAQTASRKDCEGAV